MKLIKSLGILLACFCTATMLVQLVGVGIIASKMGLDKERWFQLQAVVYEVDLGEIEKTAEKGRDFKEERRVGVESTLRDRSQNHLELINRNQSIGKTLSQVEALESEIRVRRESLISSEKTFADSLLKQEEEVVLQSLEVIQITLSSIKPSLAKDYLLGMIKGGEIVDAAEIVKAISPSKQKRIFSEFKTEEESKKLHEILQIIGQLTSQPAIDEGMR